MESTQQDLQIIRDGRYSIRMLTRKHAKMAITVAAEEFQKKEPLGLAYFRLFNERSSESLPQWTHLWQLFADEFFSNNLSVGLFDLENNEELIGTVFSKNLNFFPQGFADKIPKGGFLENMIAVSGGLNANIKPDYKEILNKKDSIPIIDLWAAAIKDQHTGKGLLHKMISANQYLGSLQGYKYSFVWASNFKTGLAVKKLKYEVISEFDVREFERDGVKHFEKIDENQRIDKYHFKAIEDFAGMTLPLTIKY